MSYGFFGRTEYFRVWGYDNDGQYSFRDEPVRAGYDTASEQAEDDKYHNWLVNNSNFKYYYFFARIVRAMELQEFTAYKCSHAEYRKMLDAVKYYKIRLDRVIQAYNH